MLAETTSASVLGVEGAVVRVEVDVAFGLPALTIVGLAGSAVLEARERVRSAIRNSGFEVPARRITINLAPADLPKDGTAYDLAIAVGILAASGQLRAAAGEVALIAELALDGALRPVPGAIALVAAARAAGLREVVVASGNVAEARCVPGIAVRGAASLGESVAHLAGVRPLPLAAVPPASRWSPAVGLPDLGQVLGQPRARRALELAVAGGHHLALCGPPGIGKTLVLRCAASLLPALDDDEAIEVSQIYSVAGLLDRRTPLLRTRPVRAPHSTISTQALVGGGPRARPGEASLAHRGVLLLDEALQFRTDALDALRQPMEAGRVAIARVGGAVTLPARFTLLIGFNPCPCGWRGSERGECRCDEAQARRYASRLSGPVRDRVDLWVTMDQPRDAVTSPDGGEPSSVVARRVAAARRRQHRRQSSSNAELGGAHLDAAHGFGAALLATLEHHARALHLSPRRIHRAAAVGRTIADLVGSVEVEPDHVAEALGYRPELAQ